jgi:hypothetical protein
MGGISGGIDEMMRFLENDGPRDSICKDEQKKAGQRSSS